MSMKHVWLDTDPGHDDATAIMLAVHCENLQLLGVSTVHGNATADCTERNAARCLHAFGAPPCVKVFRGADKPLLRQTRHDPEIHGDDGLGGVEGLPPADDPDVLSRFALDSDGHSCRALEGMAKSIRAVWKDGSGDRVSIVSCGPMTNIALFVSVYPDLLKAIEQFVFMGGGVGLGNRSAVAEYNILCDPEAAQIVLDIPVKKIMVPINVTHTAIVTQQIQRRLLVKGSTEVDAVPIPLTPLRHTLFTLINFFADAYRSTFGFVEGPPLHDALTIAYVSRPDLFAFERYRVDVELTGTHTAGETVVDVWNYRHCDDTWGPSGRNCLVVKSLNVPGFFSLLLDCVDRADVVSPSNH